MVKKIKYSDQRSTFLYLTNILKRLAAPYEQQYAEIEDFARWNLADDIVSDWQNGEQIISFLFKSKVIGENSATMLNDLLGRFDEVSYGAPNYEEIIWTLESLRDHPFWTEQRRLAKEILTELERTAPADLIAEAQEMRRTSVRFVAKRDKKDR